MDWFTFGILALVAPMPFIAAVVIGAVILLVSGQALYLLFGGPARKARGLSSTQAG
ncbi:MAG TPA: hypothetical protein PLW81_01305 [Thiobacillaceae bacterium]|nr:hypothetical protein [Thiobacillaceae bacterium]